MPEFNITIKMTGDAKQTVGVTSDMTVLQLKEKIATELDVAVERQRLIFSGKVLKDNDALSTYNIKEGHSIHLVKSAVKKEPANTGSSSPSNAIPAAPTNIEAGQNAMDPLAGLTDARYAGYNIPMPTMDQLGFGTDGMALPAEEQLTQMMDNPLFQESMRSMLSNPQMLDYMIQQSPQLRAMGPAAREMLQSDYVRNMLTNPQAMKSMMEFQRAMGGNASSLGGGGPFGGFPTPGDAGASTATGSTAPATEPSNTESTGGTTPNTTANPFATLFGANAGAAGGFGGMGGMGANPFMNPALMNMFGGNAAPASATPTDTRPPEEVYATQLRQLNDMGFFDFDRNITALRRSGGSVEGAIEMLFNGSV